MNFTEALSLEGEVTLRAYKPGTDELITEFTVPNLVTTAGKEHVARYLANQLGTTRGLTHIAVGDNDSGGATVADPTAGDTQLVHEVARARVNITGTVGASSIIQAFFRAQDINYSIRDVGLFSSDSDDFNSGTLFSRTLLSFDNSGVSPNDVVLQWNVTITSS